MSLYDALNPERAVLYLDMKDSYDEIYGSNLIIGDPYDPTNWIADAGSTLSRLSEAYLGLDALRVESGVLANPNARGLFSTTSGKRYRLALALRNIGASYAAVFSGNMVLNTTSSNFTYLQQDFTAGSALFRLWNQSTAAGQYCDFSNLSLYELRRSCKNQGKLGPATVQLGDGFTGTSFPTLIKRGMSFDGTDYINCGQAGANLTDNFTMYVCHNQTNFNTNRGWIGRREAGGNYQWLLYPPANGLNSMITNAGSKSGSADLKQMKSSRVITYSISSGYGTFYINGNQDGITHLATPFTQRTADTIIGAGRADLANPFVGPIYSVAIFPEAHSEAQIKEMTRRMMQNKSIG